MLVKNYKSKFSKTLNKLKPIINVKVSEINTFYNIPLVNKNFLRRVSKLTEIKGRRNWKKRKKREKELIEGSIHHKTNKRNNRSRIKTQFERKGVRRDPLLNVGQVWRICDTQRWNWKTLTGIAFPLRGPLVTYLGKPAANVFIFARLLSHFTRAILPIRRHRNTRELI